MALIDYSEVIGLLCTLVGLISLSLLLLMIERESCESDRFSSKELSDERYEQSSSRLKFILGFIGLLRLRNNRFISGSLSTSMGTSSSANWRPYFLLSRFRRFSSYFYFFNSNRTFLSSMNYFYCSLNSSIPIANSESLYCTSKGTYQSSLENFFGSISVRFLLLISCYVNYTINWSTSCISSFFIGMKSSLASIILFILFKYFFMYWSCNF